MRIAVYGGSFDPMHEGHIAVMRALAGCGLFDRTLVVVSPQNPLKEEGKRANAAQRLVAAGREVLARPELNAEVCDVEFRLQDGNAPMYTWRTLDVLAEEYPGDSIVLAIGADSLADMHRWSRYDYILTQYGVVVYPRTGTDLVAVRDALMEENPAFRITLLEGEKVDISSTQIRNTVARCRQGECPAGPEKAF
ncbi:MAG: nicotinate (nicotinamide) nucleotide adenylyltransferase [Bacteroidales bacterium]|nr:nicotinate (nicotinamide) nucleotide adenylyltransferase [Candidatus Cryptobacteroides aphodequi]